MTPTRSLRRIPCSVLLAAVSLAFAAPLSASGRGDEGDRGNRERPAWITGWGTSQNGASAVQLTNATVRMIARVSIPGDAVRIRLDNTYGAAVTIGSAYVGPRVQAGDVAAGTNRQVHFAGSPSVTIPAGGSVTSDAVQIQVLARQDLAVSLYVPQAKVNASQHSGAVVSSYYTSNDAGNVAATEARTPFVNTTTSMWWLKSIDVRSSSSPGAIVAFGDSITDGTCTTLDAHDRWEDIVAQRLGQMNPISRSIVNEGIGGNTVTGAHLNPPANSPPGLDRLDRDVLSHSGVSHVVLFMGTNDIRRDIGAEEV